MDCSYVSLELCHMHTICTLPLKGSLSDGQWHAGHAGASLSPHVANRNDFKRCQLT